MIKHSLKFSLDYLVTGTGRCGTVYMARSLTNWGFPCGHEAFFRFDGFSGAYSRLAGLVENELSWTSTHSKVGSSIEELQVYVDAKDIKSDSSYMAAPYVAKKILNNTKIIHVVRHPEKVIKSFVDAIFYFREPTATNEYEHFIYQFLPQLTEKRLNPYERGALYYVYWNKLIEDYADYIHRIEDDIRQLKDRFAFRGVDFEDKNINSYPVAPDLERKSCIENIISNEVRYLLEESMKKYGY